jgi:hypothetical protein
MLGAAAVLAASVARAQPAGGDNVTRARALGKEAAERLVAKDYDAAIERVTQAEALFHAPTHLRILAEAQEGLGHLADAMDTYERLVAEPLAVGAHDAFHFAQKLARKRLSDLASRVPSLLVTVRGAAAAEAATAVDGHALATASGIAVRLDAGAHKVRVEAPGFVPFEREVTLPARGGVVVLEASLDRATAVPKTIPVPSPDRPIPAPSPDKPIDPKDDDAGTRSRVPMFIAFGVGAAGLVVGAVTGAVSLSQVSDLKSRCPANQCGPADQSDIDRAEALAAASTTGFVVGAAGAAVGVLLLLFLPDQGPPSSPATGSSAVHAAPWIGLGGAGIQGSF